MPTPFNYPSQNSFSSREYRRNKKDSTSASSYTGIIDIYEDIAEDYSQITPDELNLNNGRNVNIFPYRGQFSPDLIKGLLNHFSNVGDTVLDPFVGCGTTLFEAAKKVLPAYGIEINPAAVEMAETIMFVNLSQNQREEKIEKVLNMLGDLPLFTKHLIHGSEDIHDFIKKMLSENKKDKYSYSILANGYIRFLNGLKGKSLEDYIRAIKQQAEIIRTLPFNNAEYKVFLSDARRIPLNNNTVDLVITSPPYINVFNYHQHNRKYIDTIYNNALDVAKSEFGANRKHRQNRFFTVIQYLLDMTGAFLEIKRVLKKTGRIIIIVGKTTKVRGIDFRNDHIIAGVGYLAGYKLISKQERRFLNIFGQLIYEKLLHFTPNGESNFTKDKSWDFAKNILSIAQAKAIKSEVIWDLKEAIEKVDIINSSPILK